MNLFTTQDWGKINKPQTQKLHNQSFWQQTRYAKLYSSKLLAQEMKHFDCSGFSEDDTSPSVSAVHYSGFHTEKIK